MSKYDKTELDKALNAFQKAEVSLSFAEAEINKIVSPIIKEAIKTNETDVLLELVEKLPRSYDGCRRIYEAILRISRREETENIDNE